MTWLSKFGKFAKKNAGTIGTVAGLALGGPLGGAIGGALGGAVRGGRGGGGGSAPTGLPARYDAALRGEPLPGAGMEQEYDRRALAFDPQESLNRYATGAWDTIQNRVGGVRDQLRDLGGASVGAGRLDSGFFDEDQGAVINRGMESFGSALAQQSMNATGMEQRNIEGIGATGEARGTRYLDLLAGGMDRAQAEENARRQRQADMWGSIMQAGGQVAGAYAGRGG